MTHQGDLKLTNFKLTCKCGNTNHIDKGRACDGRRAYRCPICENIWTMGTFGRNPSYSVQRPSFQFYDTGAAQL
jgi:hypothetical protein